MASTVDSDPNFMESLARGLGVLAVFENHSLLTIAEIVRLSGISRSSVGRCLHTLRRLGYILEEGGSYRLSPAMLPLSAAFLGSNPLANAAQPIVNALRDQLNESCSLAVLDSRGPPNRVIYVCRAETVRIISVPLNVGSTLPSHCTSMGRVLLASLDEAALDDYFSSVSLERRTPNTLTDPTALRAELERVRDQGWSLIDEELEMGLRSIAVPVRDRAGRTVAALNVGAQTRSQSRESLLHSALPELCAAAAHLARTIVASGPISGTSRSA
jgi:IclR family pca regulon transcriptional regulator